MTNIVVFIDWDNTLLPTQILLNNSHYFKHGKISDRDQKELTEMDEIVISLLENLKSKSILFIITNADINWINLSTKTYYPKFYKQFSHYKIISAQDLHKDKFPKDTIKWKYETFKQILDNIKQITTLKSDLVPTEKESNTDVKLHVISIADGEQEKTVIDMLKKDYVAHFKNIQIASCSSISILKKQLILINNKMDDIIKHSGDINIKLVTKKKI